MTKRTFLVLGYANGEKFSAETPHEEKAILAAQHLVQQGLIPDGEVSSPDHHVRVVEEVVKDGKLVRYEPIPIPTAGLAVPA